MSSRICVESYKLSHHIQPVGGRHPYAEELCKLCTPFVAHIVRAQASQGMYYCAKQVILNSNDIELNDFKNNLGEDALIIGRIQTSTLTPTSANTASSTFSSDWKYAADFGLYDEDHLSCHVSSYFNCSCQFLQCQQLPCRHMFCCMILQSQKVQLDRINIGKHWLKPVVNNSSQPSVSSATFTQQRTESIIDLSTVVGRRTALMSACNQMVEAAIYSPGMTKACLNHLLTFSATYQQNNHSAVTKTKKTGRQPVSHNSSASKDSISSINVKQLEDEEEEDDEDDIIPISALRIGTNVMDAVDSRKDEDSDEYDMAISSLGIGNPPLCKSQHQRRKLPTNPAAPTTKGYKRASQISTKEKREQKKKEKSQSLGLIA